jgi:hypothetical protein
MAEYTVPAGQRTRVFRRFSSSLIQSITIDAEPAQGHGIVSGTLEVRGSRWLFTKPPETYDQLHTQTVAKGYWDTRYEIYVTPRTDMRISGHRPRLGRPQPPSFP